MSLKIACYYTPEIYFINGRQKYKGIRNFWHIQRINKMKGGAKKTTYIASLIFNSQINTD